MPEWPPIEEPELRRRLAMDEATFGAYIDGLVGRLPARSCDAAAIALALGYPWERPRGSYLLRGELVVRLAELEPAQREDVLARFAAPAGDRLPLLSIGSNGAPEALRRKFAHFESEPDRDVLVLTGHLRDFDVGAAAQPALYGSLPATLFPSPGTAVRAAVLWVTPAQFAQLTWSELSYRLGRLRARFEVEESGHAFERVAVFVSRFGGFCPRGDPVALAAVPARGRRVPALTQAELLTTAARLTLGPEAGAEDWIRAVVERPAELFARLPTTLHRAARPFHSERWAPFR